MSNIFITPKEKIDMYFASPELQQSMLKKLGNGTLTDFIFHKENKVDLSDKAGILIGSAVDTWLTHSEEAYREEYYESTTAVPGEKVQAAIDTVFNLIVEDCKSIDGEVTPETIKAVKSADLKNFREFILLAVDKVEYYPNWKEDTRINKIIEAGAYFTSLQMAFGKKVISPEEANLIRNICTSLISNPRTKKYFDRKYQASLTNMEFHYQVPIYFKYAGVDCKALMDLIIVCKDDKGKVLWVQGVDLKTTRFETLSFLQAVKAQGYHIQASWYTLAIHDWIKQMGYIIYPFDKNNPSNSEAHIPEVKNFTFVVETTIKNEVGKKPLVFKCSNTLLDIGLNGREPVEITVVPYPTNQTHPEIQLFGKGTTGDVIPLTSESLVVRKRIFGIKQLLSIYLYHVQHGFGEERVLKENKLKPITLDWDDDFRELYIR